MAGRDNQHKVEQPEKCAAKPSSKMSHEVNETPSSLMSPLIIMGNGREMVRGCRLLWLEQNTQTPNPQGLKILYKQLLH